MSGQTAEFDFVAALTAVKNIIQERDSYREDAKRLSDELDATLAQLHRSQEAYENLSRICLEYEHQRLQYEKALQKREEPTPGESANSRLAEMRLSMNIARNERDLALRARDDYKAQLDVIRERAPVTPAPVSEGQLRVDLANQEVWKIHPRCRLEPDGGASWWCSIWAGRTYKHQWCHGRELQKLPMVLDAPGVPSTVPSPPPGEIPPESFAP